VTEQHVHEIMCPIIERERDELRDRMRHAERVIVRLRQLLRAADPSLPHECDGNAWAPLEAVVVKEAA
jgi:hypothetical protein